MRFLRKYIFANAGLKLLALAISFLLWATYTSEPFAEVGFQVPLEFTSMPPQLEISGDVPTSVHVRVRGRSAFLRRMVAADLNLRMDMKDSKEGTTSLQHHAGNGGRSVWRDGRAGFSLGNPRYSCATPRASPPAG